MKQRKYNLLSLFFMVLGFLCLVVVGSIQIENARKTAALCGLGFALAGVILFCLAKNEKPQNFEIWKNIISKSKTHKQEEYFE